MSSEIHKYIETAIDKKKLFDADVLDFPVNKKELVKNFELDKKKYWKINDSSNNDQLKAVKGICLVFGFLLTMGLLANLTSI